MDDRVSGREYELAIHFVTPFSEDVDNLPKLQANSAGRAELMIVLPSNSRLVLDIFNYKKTENMPVSITIPNKAILFWAFWRSRDVKMMSA